MPNNRVYQIIVFKGNLQLTCQRVVPNNRVERIFPTLGQKQMFFYHFISSETDEVRAKREPSLCNESVKRYFWFFSYTAAIETQIGDNTKRAPTARPFLPLLFLHSCN